MITPDLIAQANGEAEKTGILERAAMQSVINSVPTPCHGIQVCCHGLSFPRAGGRFFYQLSEYSEAPSS